MTAAMSCGSGKPLVVGTLVARRSSHMMRTVTVPIPNSLGEHQARVTPPTDSAQLTQSSLSPPM